MSYAVQWDAENPLHIGRTGDFTYFPGLFGGFLNPPSGPRKSTRRAQRRRAPPPAAPFG